MGKWDHTVIFIIPLLNTFSFRKRFPASCFFTTKDRKLLPADEFYFSTPYQKYGFAGPQNYINNSTLKKATHKKGRTFRLSLREYY